MKRFSQNAIWSIVCISICAAYTFWAGIATSTSVLELGLTAPPISSEYYNQLIAGFEQGHEYMRSPPPEGLLQMKDPYDPVANLKFRRGVGSMGIGHLHDVTLFNGRLYLYFSAIPALICFLPFHILTGIYLPQSEVCAFFCAIGFLAQSLLLRDVYRSFFADVRGDVLIVCVFGLGTLNVAPLVMRRPDVWEVPICASFCFSALALLGLMQLLRGGRNHTRDACLVSLFCGLAIGCRPTAIPLILLLILSLDPSVAPATGEGWMRLLLALGAPIGVIGCSLMIYNYSRFGSPFEFGMKYQLLGDKPDIVKYSARFTWVNFKIYFLQPCLFRSEFPYIQPGIPRHFPPKHLGIESAFGLITNLPVNILACFAILHRPRAGWFKDRFYYAIVICAFVLLALISLGLCLFAGAPVRYELEFAPYLALLSMIGILVLEQRYANTSKALLVRSAWCFLLLLSITFILLERNNRLLYFKPSSATEVYNSTKIPPSREKIGSLGSLGDVRRNWVL